VALRRPMCAQRTLSAGRSRWGAPEGHTPRMERVPTVPTLHPAVGVAGSVVAVTAVLLALSLLLLL